MLFVFLEMVPFPQGGFRFVVLVGEIALPAGTEIDMPPPESPEDGFRVLVILRPEFTGFAWIRCHSVVFIVLIG